MSNDLRRLWIAQLVSLAGDFLAIFAVVSTASFRLHASPAAITGVTISYMLPLALLGPVAGAFADRWNPRRTMITSDLLRAALVLLLLLPGSLAGMCIILFVISVVSSSFNPAQTITMRALANRDNLLRMNVLFQQTALILRIACPVTAAALVAAFGPRSCFLADAGSFLFSAALLSGVKSCISINPASRPGTAFGFLSTRPNLVVLILAIAAASFALSCTAPLLAVFVRDLLGAGVRVYGVITALLGFGMIAGVQSIRGLVRRCSPSTVVELGLAMVGLGLAQAALAASAVALAGGALAIGAGAGLLTAPAQTIIQSETPLELLGRVSSTVTSLVAMAQILGLLLAGTLAAKIGIRPIFWISALFLCGVAILVRSAQSCTILQNRPAAHLR
jgi:DHA3 family macrolide efflux protein-like MFS transporter